MTKQKTAILGLLSDALILELTADLVAIPTRNPPGEEAACARFIHDTLTGWGIEAELIDRPDPARPQVVARVAGCGAGPTFVLNAHMDTVPEGDPDLWTRPPFEATREGDRLYGLGACDMKGSLASIMAMLKALHDSGAWLPGTLLAHFPMGEEMDEPGTKTLLAMGHAGDMAITMEPTDSRIGPGTRGACWHRVVIEGPAAHCGLAEPDAPDALHAARRFMAEVESAHAIVGGQTHHLLASPACRVTRMTAGETHNATARRCEMVVDRRMLPHESVAAVGDDLRARLDRALGGIAGLRGEVTFLDLNEATETPSDSPLVRALSDNIRRLGGAEPEVWGPPYGSDMRNFVCDAGMPCVNFGAGDFRRCHQPDEFVPVTDLLRVARITFGTVLDVIG
ncbi:M20 family metallopeptidase [Roseovarius salinarum]|uniref:M20 family metallopeptidase n=1 Tax=Roseovarius salinarum TaxID=1981892 RepID=UPI000C33F277|nr:M20/M25/M40 family metallo-hydrolase [Roseovarius salinarum]